MSLLVGDGCAIFKANGFYIFRRFCRHFIMQLTLFTDYALRVLMYAANKNEGLVTMKEISDFYSISPDHLRKVIHTLSKTGYINSYRGKKGGIELAMESDKILVGEVIKEMEGGEGIIDCEARDCLLTPDCILKGAISAAMKAFYAQLNQYTLSDIATGGRMQNYFGRINL